MNRVIVTLYNDDLNTAVVLYANGRGDSIAEEIRNRFASDKDKLVSRSLTDVESWLREKGFSEPRTRCNPEVLDEIVFVLGWKRIDNCDGVLVNIEE